MADERKDAVAHDIAGGVSRSFNTLPLPGQTRDCLDPWYNPFIQPDGGVWPCCWFYSALGNVKQEPFDEIVNGQRFRELRRELLTGQLRAQCRECPSRSTATTDGLLSRLRASKKEFPPKRAWRRLFAREG
jgi:radical SAM protein with 4Fe4S-binding SPASM domain